MTEWKETRLGEIAVIVMGQSPKGETCNANGKGVPLLNGPTEFGLKYPFPIQFTNDARRMCKENDILFCVRGSTTGRMNWANRNYAIGRGLAAISHKKGSDYRHYIKGVIDYNLPYLLSSATGSTFPNVSRSDLENLKIAAPPLPEQKAIASVLSSLDDKIDLLHRQNKTLEAMAETLFRQWFIEEAGEEWEEGTIENIFILQRGFDLPIQSRVAGSYPIFAASGHGGYHNESKVKAPGVTTGRSGLLGKVFFILENFWPLNTSLFIKEYRIGTPLFSYFLLKTIDLDSFNAGSAVPTLNRNHVHEHKILIPPKSLILEFENMMIPNFKKIHFNKTQIRTHEKLRDTLLPKLMSGEVSVALENVK